MSYILGESVRGYKEQCGLYTMCNLFSSIGRGKGALGASQNNWEGAEHGLVHRMKFCALFGSLGKSLWNFQNLQIELSLCQCGG